jgi:signal transduction histidine kinase
MNAAIYVNKTYVGAGGQFTEPITNNWNRAQFFVIPPSILRLGENTLFVRLWAYANTSAGLSVVRVGEQAILQKKYESRLFFQTTTSQLAFALIAAYSVVMLLIWARGGRESIYGFFGLSMLSFTITNLFLFVKDPIVSSFHWGVISFSALCWTNIFLTLFMLRYTQRHWPRFERFLFAVAFLCPIIMLSVGFSRLAPIAGTMFVLILILVAINGWLLSLTWRRTRSTDVVLLWIINAVWFWIGVHDLLVHFGILSYEALLVMPYAATGMSFAMTWMLVNRFSQTIAENIRKQNAILEERKRIMRDMHDGMGSQLMSALSYIESGQTTVNEVATILRESIDDIRLTIDSLEPTSGDLLSMLGNFRYRMQPRLKAAGIALEWNIQDIPSMTSTTPTYVLNVLRIVQEASTNILKHARASKVEVETGTIVSGKEIFIRIADNGRGFVDPQIGNGFKNMRDRAQRLGGKVDIQSTNFGTVVSLVLPVDARTRDSLPG